MKLRHLLLVVLALHSVAHAENEVGFIERFALAADREKVLTQLVPGTEDYYFFHSLHYQNTKQAPKLASVLDQWRKRFVDSARRKIIENREALLAYDADPQRTLKFLRDTLNLQFNHVQEARDQKPNLPTQLDGGAIARDVFRKEALQDDNLGSFTPEALADLVLDKVPLRPPQRRALLQRIQRPNIPGLVELIAAELKTPENPPFGEFDIHSQLLPEQLDALTKLVPRIASEQSFVFARIRKLAPNADEDAEYDFAAREAWLDRVWSYVKTLPTSFNSLKAAVLHRRLDHDRRKGVYDAARFAEYLRLPRQTEYAAPRWVERLASQNVVWADLNASFADAGLAFAPIGTDELLVRDYLIHLFAAAGERARWEDYGELLRDTWLKPVFAEAMIVHGIGNPERWAPLLSPAAYQRLKDRVDLDFAAENPQFVAPGDVASVDVWVKNTPKLIVKIYELNALNYFLTHRRQLNTDLPLDGLVANAETTHSYDDSPLRRVRRTFTFPELKGRRGAWMIELIGGGRSSRALIRKGQWHLVQQTGPAGDLLTVLDEQRAVVKDAAIWLDGRKLTPDPKTLAVAVPFTAEPGQKQVVISDATGTFATLTEFEHHAEGYQFDAQFHVEREKLLGGREALLAIRAALRVHESEIPVSLLKEPTLTITTTTLDGISTTREVRDLKFDPAKVLVHKLPVPERLAVLSVTLGGYIEQLARGGERQHLSAQASWQVNGIDRTEATSDGHLARTDTGYAVDLLGKNGEPLADRQVVFHFRHKRFSNTVTVPLRTDARGRVLLGPLPQIEAVIAKLPDGRERRWQISESQPTVNSVLQLAEGMPFEMPLSRAPAHGQFALLEVRNGTYSGDATNRIALPPAEPDATPLLAGSGLPAGDYRLLLPDENRQVEIKVSKGIAARGWVHGTGRSLQLSVSKPLNIARIETTAAELIVSVANVNPFTRVHVGATRYIDHETSLAALMRFNRFGVASELPAKLPSLYAGGRDIGDEYRYILERRYAQKFPGNMLARPGLLLNPWEKRSTDQVGLQQQAGQAAPGAAGGRGRQVAPPEAMGIPALEPIPADAAGIQRQPTDPDLDFLAAPAPVLYNLVPDKDGIVRIDRKLLGDRPLVQVYAEDLRDAVWRQVALPDIQPQLKDLRLTRNLDPAKPFAQKKEVSMLATGQTLTLQDLLTSELQTYDTFGSLFSLYQTLSANETLAKFAWLLQWPTMKDEEKRAKYGEFACHELNFLLSRKDQDFFGKIVQPYLRNKKEKTFLDDYLIGADLNRYLEPWRFAQLNAVERALLASRLKAAGSGIARHLRELWELLPPNPDETDRLFETALRGRAMEEGQAVALNLAQAQDHLWAAQPSSVRSFGSVALDAPAAPAGAATGVVARNGGYRYSESDLEKQAELKAKTKAGTALGVEQAPEQLSRTQARAVDFAGKLWKDTAGEGVFWDTPEAEELRQQVKALAYYRKIGTVKEWAENNYYYLPIEQQNAQLIPVNAFWRDFAAWLAGGAKAPFLSANFAEAHRNFSEIMLALAVLDLPFEGGKHDTKTDGPAFTLTAAGPLIAVHKQIKPAAPAPAQTELLVSQNFYRHGDRYRQEGNDKFDKYVTDEFLAGAVYGASIVATNPTSAPQKLDLLMQIPRGAIPVLGSKATDSKHVRLEPFTTQRFEYFFYFPAPNAGPDERFPHYPVVLATNEQVVGSAKPFTFHVVGKLSQVDKASWDYISQYSSDADVLSFIEQNNIERLDLARVAWRCRQNVEFYRKLVAVLSARHRFDPTIYGYAVHHNDTATLREWLRHRDDLLEQCGPWLDGTLVKLDPIERKRFEQLDYAPVVNQRAHRLGSEHRIPNNVLLGQYRTLLDILSYKPTLDPMDALSVVSFLFVQDRVDEALARFKAINVNALSTRIQHDYLRCYAAFYEANLAEARGIANQYTSFPVERWRNLFADVIAQLDEVEGKAGVVKKESDQPDRERDTADAAGTAPTFDFKVENRTVALTWRNLPEATVNYYLIDPEFSFSSNPFVSEDASRFAIVRPTQTAALTLPKDKDSLDVPLPGEFAKANVVVEIVAAGQRKAQVYHANTLKLNTVENYGRLELRDQAAGKAVSKAYVKVYARLNNSTVRFFKDGYTDLRGRFDYASLNSAESVIPLPDAQREASRTGRTSGTATLDTQMLQPAELDQVARLSILVLSEANGAVVREVGPPRQ